MAKFESQLDATLIKDDNGRRRARWKLDAPLGYWSDLIGRVIVPMGFVTDFASVPRMILAWMIAGGVGNAPAALHDYLYSRRCHPRALCDQVFLEALLCIGVAPWRAQLMYLGVRAFGWRRWQLRRRKED